MAQYGLIEAGGTKFVLGISDVAGQIAARHQVPTTTPDETIGACLDWFAAQGLAPTAIGIASFGPLCLDRDSPQWGRVTNTPKPHWSGADLVGPFAAAYGVPVGIETDVNGAALAEARWGAGVGHGSVLYLTIGTGVGGGFVSGGRLLSGLSHPEMGHIRLPRHPDDLAFAGHCPFHGACLEGLAAGPSIIARWGASLSDLPADHPGADIIAWYLGQAAATFQAIMEPARIVMGGGVMATPGLIARVRAHAVQAGAGYFVGDAAQIIVPPGLGNNAGLLGALAVALGAVAQNA
ncbi:ROK family protein [Novosphingobium sp. FSY-8]|uniref:fructokinase n=1 Tax=Novosphingobium ovatum TaxID=1908523 RepID=A0ABW9XF03_9SPHN|nr:ROK family protein [Novosphingobium ovatum]NBC37125.1 ROK family protein [Novosphingobium ovatum]